MSSNQSVQLKLFYFVRIIRNSTVIDQSCGFTPFPHLVACARSMIITTTMLSRRMAASLNKYYDKLVALVWILSQEAWKQLTSSVLTGVSLYCEQQKPCVMASKWSCMDLCVHVDQHTRRRNYTKSSVKTHPDLEDTSYGAVTLPMKVIRG